MGFVVLLSPFIILVVGIKQWRKSVAEKVRQQDLDTAKLKEQQLQKDFLRAQILKFEAYENQKEVLKILDAIKNGGDWVTVEITQLGIKTREKAIKYYENKIFNF